MARMLGIDTATTGCSVALMDGETCLGAKLSSMARGQSEALMPMLESVMRDADLSVDQLDGIAVTRGPGAFTGLRIGLSAARALALATAKPCIGIGTFDVLAAQAFQHPDMMNDSTLLVAIESKREEIFICGFAGNGTVTAQPSAQLPENIHAYIGAVTNLTIVGDASDKAEQALHDAVETYRIRDIELPDPRVVARLGLEFLATPEQAPPTPMYLRPPDVSLPKPK